MAEELRVKMIQLLAALGSISINRDELVSKLSAFTDTPEDEIREVLVNAEIEWERIGQRL